MAQTFTSTPSPLGIASVTQAAPNRSTLEQQGYIYLGTQNAVNTAKAKFGSARVKKIGNSMYVLPKDTRVPTTSTPLPAKQLPTGESDLTKLLGVPSIPTDIGGLMSLYGRSSQEQQRVDELQKQLTELMGDAGNQATDLQAELTKQGVQESYNQVQELTLKAAKLQGDLTSFDAETETNKAAIADQPIPTGLIAGQQAQLRQQRDLTRLSKAAELSGTIALAQAYQGKAQLGAELARNAVDLKYQPILAKIDTTKTQLGIAMEKADKADKIRYGIIDQLLTDKRAEIAKQQEQENAIESVAIEAAGNGAPLHLITSIKQAGSPAEAARLASKYLNSNVQFRRQKEMEAIQHKNRLGEIAAQRGGEGPDTKLLDNLLGKKYSAAEQIGFSRVPKSDGGFDFIYTDPKTGKSRPITVEEYTSGTGLTFLDAIKGSRAAQDVLQNLPDKAKATIDALSSAKVAFSRIQDAVSRVSFGSGVRARIGGFLGKLSAKAGTNPAVKNLQNVGEGFLSTIARASGEKGTLAEGDVARARQLIPQATDTQKEVQDKLRNLEDFLREKEESTIRVYGGVQVEPQGQQPAEPDYSDLLDSFIQ